MVVSELWIMGILFPVLVIEIFSFLKMMYSKK